jgi:single-stranded-DNA-specific exonuclease
MRLRDDAAPGSGMPEVWSAPPRMRWVTAQPDAQLVSRLAHEARLSPLLARLLALRGIQDGASALRFLSPNINQLHDPWLMEDMGAAVARLRRSIQSKEKILIYGDYDVDGTMATVSLLAALKSEGAVVEAHIPHRLREGYGVQREVLTQAAREGARVVVTVDTGIREHEALHHARQLGLSVIVTDHHLPGETLPEACAILNPHRADCRYPDKNLAGVGVACKLVQALLGEKLSDRLLRSYLKLAALGTIADVAPLTGENRVIARFGLEGLTRAASAADGAASGGRAGLWSLLSVAGLERRVISCADVAFRLAPRLNAAGRMESARDVIDLFSRACLADARAIAERLENMNRSRQKQEDEILGEIKRSMADGNGRQERFSMVFSGAGWHRGVIGIVAQRIVELCNRPTLVISIEDGTGYGSGRSIPGFHLLDALQEAKDQFTRFGGHAQAAGFTLPGANVPRLEEVFERAARSVLTGRDLERVLRVDAELSLDEIGRDLYEEMKSLEPFGLGNPKPVFRSRVTLAGEPRILKEKHLKIWVRAARKTLPAIGWGMGGWAARLAGRSALEIAFTLAENQYQGETTLQLHLKDIHFDPDPA